MLPRSKKAKGRRLQNLIQAGFQEIVDPKVGEPGHVYTRGMGQSGSDVYFSPTVRKWMPWCIECKNDENLVIWAAIRQNYNSKDFLEDSKSLIFLDRNRAPHPLVVMRLNAFREMYPELPLTELVLEDLTKFSRVNVWRKFFLATPDYDGLLINNEHDELISNPQHKGDWIVISLDDFFEFESARITCLP